MSPTVIRQFWSLIEVTQPHILLSLDDATLVRNLVNQFQDQGKLNADQTQDLSTYIHHRLPLIRDLAQERNFLCQQ